MLLGTRAGGEVSVHDLPNVTAEGVESSGPSAQKGHMSLLPTLDGAEAMVRLDANGPGISTPPVRRDRES